jgi:hypothetical protein
MESYSNFQSARCLPELRNDQGTTIGTLLHGNYHSNLLCYLKVKKQPHFQPSSALFATSEKDLPSEFALLLWRAKRSHLSFMNQWLNNLV